MEINNKTICEQIYDNTSVPGKGNSIENISMIQRAPAEFHFKAPGDTRFLDFRGEEGEVVKHITGKLNIPLTGLNFKMPLQNIVLA